MVKKGSPLPIDPTMIKTGTKQWALARENWILGKEKLAVLTCGDIPVP